MRVLVTGSQGQVAQALRAASSPGVEVVAIGRPDLELTDPGAVLRAILAARPDAVVSAAAYTAVDLAEDEPELARAVNVDGAAAVALAAAQLGAPLVHLSTDYVFDGRKPTSYVEEDATAPLGVYGVTKLAGETAVAAAQPDHVILRVAWVYSPYGTNFVKTMVRLAAEREIVKVVDDQIGRPTSADDIADIALSICGAMLAQRDDAALRGVFHFAPAGCATWADVAEAVFAGSAARGGPSAQVERIATTEFPTRAVRPANSRLDGSRLRAALSLSAVPWTHSLSRCLDRLIT